MRNEIKKFLEFNGKVIYFTAANGTNYVAIKPICEALGVDYSRQLRTLKADPILGQLWSLQTIVAADSKPRKMVCLTEMYIYGWIFSIESQSKTLIKYKKECYEVLFNHFRGTITKRIELLEQRHQLKSELTFLQQQSKSYKRINEIKSELKTTSRGLISCDKDLLNGQYNLPF